MNSAQRRTTYRRLRKLMREKTPVFFSGFDSGRTHTRGLIKAVMRQQGVAVVSFKRRHGQVHDYQVSGWRLRTLPRCQQVAL